MRDPNSPQCSKCISVEGNKHYKVGIECIACPQGGFMSVAIATGGIIMGLFAW